MNKNPDGALLPRQSAQDRLPWRFAAIVAVAVAIVELLTHLLVRHLPDWLTHIISFGLLVLVSALLITWLLRRRTDRVALAGTEHLLRERTQVLDALIQ